MTWVCAPEEYRSSHYASQGDYVRLRFVESPSCFEVESGKDLCRRLQSVGKPIVDVEFEKRLSGYRISSIEGQPIEFNGGWASSGKNSNEVCPIH
jgi:hypothetical protein